MALTSSYWVVTYDEYGDNRRWVVSAQHFHHHHLTIDSRRLARLICYRARFDLTFSTYTQDLGIR